MSLAAQASLAQRTPNLPPDALTPSRSHGEGVTASKRDCAAKRVSHRRELPRAVVPARTDDSE